MHLQPTPKVLGPMPCAMFLESVHMGKETLAHAMLGKKCKSGDIREDQRTTISSPDPNTNGQVQEVVQQHSLCAKESTTMAEEHLPLVPLEDV